MFTFNFENTQENQTIQSNQINQTNHLNQRNYVHNNRGGDIGTFNCGEGGDEIGPLIIVVGILLVAFLGFFLMYKLCQFIGKTNSAYCSIIFLSLIHLGISIICFGFIFSVNLYVIIGGFSSFLFIFTILLIFISFCLERKRNNDLKNIETKTPILMQENGNNNILVKDNYVTTQRNNQKAHSKMNNIGKLIESINPIYSFERNDEKYNQCFDNKNELLNNQNYQISQTPNSRISDLSNAPLPNDVNLPTEEEIYKNYSNL